MEHLFGKWLPDLPASVSDGISLPMNQLLKARSLTTALRALPHLFSVELLKLGELETECGGRLVREVLLKLDGIPVVAARSECRIGSAFWQTFWTAVRALWASVCFKPIWKGRVQRLSLPFTAKDAGGTLPLGVRGFPITVRKCC